MVLCPHFLNTQQTSLFLTFTYNKGSCSNSLPTSQVSTPVISTFKDLPVFPGNRLQMPQKKITCLLQQEMIYQTITALTIIFLQSSTCLWSGDAMPSHHIRLLLIASSGRTPLIQKSRISRKKMYAKRL